MRSPLLAARSGLALIRLHRVQHDLVRQIVVVVRVSFAPVVRHGVGENAAGAVEIGCADCAADFGVAFQTVLGVLIPEVEGAVATGCAEGSMFGVEGDGVDGVDVCDVALVGDVLAVALETEVGSVGEVVSREVLERYGLAYPESLSSTY